MMFPIEVWEIIFQHSEAVNLLRFKSVCSQWNDCIPKMLQDNDKWYKQCMKDIPESDRSIILEKLCPYSDGIHFHKYIKLHNIWKAMYHSWMKWANLKNMTRYSIEKIFTVSSLYDLENITCVATSGSLLVVGSNDGYIRCYNMNERKRKPIFVADHASSVSDIKIIEDDENIICVSLLDNNIVQFWEIGEKTPICNKVADVLSSSHGFIFLLHRNILTVQGLHTSKIYAFNDSNPEFKAIVGDKNEVFLWSSKGVNVQLRLENDDWKYEYHNIQPPMQRLVRYKAFKCGVATSISIDGILSISVNYKKWISYNIYTILQAMPTCVYFYSRTFIIGLDIGIIYVYHVKDLDDLINIDFNAKEAAAKVEICTSPISSLDILEHNQDQFIIATCNKYVYIVKFHI